MGKYYIGDPEKGKFSRMTTSVRIRVDQIERIRKEHMNFSYFIEDCLDYYWGTRKPADDIKDIEKRASAASKVKPFEAREVPKEKIEKKKVYCPNIKQDVYEDFFKSDLCDYENCRFFQTGECRFAKKE